MKRLIVLLLLLPWLLFCLESTLWAQSSSTNPYVRPMCTAATSVNCTPQVIASGVWRPLINTSVITATTFVGNLTGIAQDATFVNAASTSLDANYLVLLGAASSGYITANNASGFTFNPSTNVLTTTAVSSLVRGSTYVTTSTAYTLAGIDVRKTVFDNNGAGGSVTFNLPTATAGMSVGFYVIASQTVVIHPATGDQIMVLTGGINTNITLAATRGTYVFLYCRVAGQWEPVGQNGTIT